MSEATQRADVPAQRTQDSARIEIYVYYDTRGIPLYVGITGRPPKREAEHAYRSAWVRYKASKEALEYAESMDDALAREAYLIRRLRPVFNIQQAGADWRKRRESYLTLFDPDVLGTPDAVLLLMDPEAAEVEGLGAEVGTATRYVLAKFRGDEASKRLLLALAASQDAPGNNGWCGWATAEELQRAHGGNSQVYNLARERLGKAGWTTHRDCDRVRLPANVERYTDDGQRFPLRVATCDEDLAEAAQAAKPRGRRRY